MYRILGGIGLAALAAALFAQAPADRPEALAPANVEPSAHVISAAGWEGGAAEGRMQKSIAAEGAADEGSDLVLRTPDGVEQMRITAAGNTGIGTATPSTKLHVDGPIISGKKIVAMGWRNIWSAPSGYVKLVTPIVVTESNMFQIHIVGYRYSPPDTFDIRCSGYAYAGVGLTRTTCHTEGTSLPVELGAETRTAGADPVVVVRIGTPASTWYYGHFSMDYDGWVAKSPADFQWVLGETTPAQAGNLNNIFADDNTGVLTVGAQGDSRTTTRMRVHGASVVNGKLTIDNGSDNSQGIYVAHNPTFEPGGAAQLDYGAFIHAAEDVQAGASNGGGVIGVFTKSHLNGAGTMTTATGAHVDVGAAVSGGTVLSGIGLKVNFTRAAGSSITTGTGVYVNDVLATNDYAFYQAGADDTNFFAGDLLVGASAVPGMKLVVGGNAHFTGVVTGTEIRATYQDLAEWVPSSSDLEPGTVVVLDPAVGNGVMPSRDPYDTTVAGVVSAQPGITLGEAGDAKEKIATTGRVRVRVDATRAPIRVGDLLVTSDKPGVAMRSTPIDVAGIAIHRPGTIVGKALQGLADGEGEILVLLSLQ